MDKVDILLSIYNPNINFLVKQLKSLDNQTYKNIELIVFDDCVESRTDRKVIENEIKNIKLTFLPYEEKNLGYAKAFEKLINASTGKYIAFCDQDDIWNDDKIEKCINTLIRDDSLLVASDRTIIDENDKVIIPSVREKSNKNYESWETGDDIVKYNIFVTYAVGMCIVMNGDFARTITPISKYTGHDKWAICCAGIEGKISFINEQLVKYRRHGKNVSGILKDVNNKSDYYLNRIIPHDNIIHDLLNKYPNFKDKDELLKISEARKKNHVSKLIKYQYIAPDVIRFEILLAILPDFLFKLMLSIVKKSSND